MKVRSGPVKRPMSLIYPKIWFGCSVHSSSTDRRRSRSKCALRSCARPGHRLMKWSTVPGTFMVHAVQMGSYLCDVRKVFNKGLQLARSWLRTTSARRHEIGRCFTRSSLRMQIRSAGFLARVCDLTTSCGMLHT